MAPQEEADCRSEMEHLKHLHSVLPNESSISQLASKFNISAHSVTRILSSKFEPSPAMFEFNIKTNEHAWSRKSNENNGNKKIRGYKWTRLRIMNFFVFE